MQKCIFRPSYRIEARNYNLWLATNDLFPVSEAQVSQQIPKSYLPKARTSQPVQKSRENATKAHASQRNLVLLSNVLNAMCSQNWLFIKNVIKLRSAIRNTSYCVKNKVKISQILFNCAFMRLIALFWRS